MSDEKDSDIPVLNMPWFESPFFEALLEKSKLSDEEKDETRFFKENGYLIFDPEIENFEALADDLTTNFAEEYDQKRTIRGDARILDGWSRSESMRAIASAPMVLKKLETLYQRRPFPFQTLNFDRGTEQATHSDSVHFSSWPASFMSGVWVALEDIDENNGPLHYYPGSHKLPAYDLNTMGINASDQNDPMDNYPRYEEFIAKVIKALKLEKTNIKVKKGQALIWANCLLHGGSKILDPKRTRHSQVTHYYYDNCVYYQPLMSDPFRQRIHQKPIFDIGKMDFAPHQHNGHQLEVLKRGGKPWRLNKILRKHGLEKSKKPFLKTLFSPFKSD